jgi:DNA repair protein RecO (recombination protein O)
MAEARLQAVVLRRTDSGESDRRLTLFTREEGRMDVIAKGARKGGSRLAGVSEPLSCATFQVAVGRRRRYVTQAQPVSSFPGLRADYERLSLALALCEAYAAVCQPDNPDPDGFDLLVLSLRTLEAHPSPAVALVWAELRLLHAEGVQPGWIACAVDGGQIAEDPAWLSPTAGGYVSQQYSREFADRFQVAAEVAIGLAKTAELDGPPVRLKRAPECLRALLPFLLHMAHAPLPASESALRLL